MRYARLAWFAIFVLFLPQPSHGQMVDNKSANTPFGLMSTRPQQSFEFDELKEGEQSHILVFKDGRFEFLKMDWTASVTAIVEFVETPFFLQGQEISALSALTASAYQARFSQFENDLRIIHEKIVKSLAISPPRPIIKREFYKIFFGMAIAVPRAALPEIQRLPYVKAIHVDNPVKATLDESVPLIRADSVWAFFETQGDGIVVGILDTGIDYMHPALGGGFGPGFKVIGGYDLVNNDSDPRDDNFHGTHVAGIVAADGDSVRGVAPHALLMAFKILNDQGAGASSDIIAGLERALDPNNDGDFSDKVDIANLSLSSDAGDPDDAASTAVDRAVKLGMVVCVAAGNAGRSTVFGFNTIGSPGTARQAITVGASDKSDELANFSSRGPNSKIFSIKPEVVAPGVNIRSTFPLVQYARLDGTSMATPHVAGVCALLKAIHPDWTPVQIKSALMTTAVDLGDEVMAQGAGRIDAWRAANTKVLIAPAHLSFGSADVTQAVWTVSDTIAIVNQLSSPQDFGITVSGLQAGLRVDVAPTQFNLPGGGAQEVIVTLRVENDFVPYPTAGSLAYSGNIVFNSGAESWRLPWAFAKTSKLVLTSDQPFPSIYLSSDSYLASSFPRGDDPFRYELILPKGIYDIVAVFARPEEASRVVFHENVAVEGLVELSLKTTDALHAVEFNSVDEQNRPLASLPNLVRDFWILFPESSLFSGVGTVERRGGRSIFSSSFSQRFTFQVGEYQDDLGQGNNFRIVRHAPFRGLSGNISLQNAPTDFIMQNVKADFPPGAETRYVLFPYTSRIFLSLQNQRAVISLSTGAARAVINADAWSGKLYLTPQSHEQSLGHTTFLVAGPSPTFVTVEPQWFISQPFLTVNDSIGCFDFLTPAIYFSPDGGTMSFGTAPIYTNAYHLNNWYGPSNIALFAPNGFGTRFFGALNEWRHADGFSATVKVYDGRDSLIASSDELNQFAPLNVSAGPYRTEIANSNYYVRGVRGAATLNAKFDLRRSDATPPFLTSLKLLNSQNSAVDRLEPGERATVIFSAIDPDVLQGKVGRWQSLAVDSIKLHYKLHGAALWQNVSLTRVRENSATGVFYAADFSGRTSFDSAAVDLRIEAKDQSGNSIVWTQEPAFAIGKFGIVVSVDSTVAHGERLPQKFALHTNYPNPFNPATTIAFDLPKRARVRLKVYDVRGAEVRTLILQLLPAGQHRVHWDGRNNIGHPVASGVYFYQIRADNFAATRKMALIR